MKQDIEKPAIRAKTSSCDDRCGWTFGEGVDSPHSVSLLVQDAKRGDQASRRQLCEAFRKGVYAFVSRIVGSDCAGDLTRDIFVQAFRDLEAFDEQSTFDVWLLRIAVVRSLEQIGNDIHKSVDVASQPNDIGATAILDEQRLEKALQRLAPDHRVVLLLREGFGLCYAEIAQVVQVSSETVSERLSHGRQSLQTHLTDLGWKG